MKLTIFAVTIYGKDEIVDIFNTREEAVKAIQEKEELDMEIGIYEPGYYEIREIPTF